MKIAAFYENIREGAETANISLEEAFAQLKAAGMDLIYANYEEFKKDLPVVKEAMDKTGIGLEGFYGFMDFPHNFPDEQRYKECIDLCAEYGGTNVLLLPGVILPDEEEKRAELTENMFRGLELACDYAEAQGKGVRVTLEDFDGLIAPYNCISGMKMFFDNVEKLKCALDTGNFVMYHEDEMEAFHLFKNRLALVHMKDRSLTPVNPGDIAKSCDDGSVIYPCPVGRGYIRIPEIIAELKADGYTGNFVAELYDCDKELMLEEIGNSVRFLKTEIEK